MTGALSRIDIRGRDGVSLRDFWAERGPVVATSGSRSRGSRTCSSSRRPEAPRRQRNFVAALEQHVEWIGDCIALPARQRLPHHRSAARCAAGVDRAHHVAGGADGAGPPDVQLLVQRRQRARQEADVHGLHGGIPEYRRRCDEIADAGYTGFKLACDEDCRTGLAHRSGLRRRAAAGACRACEAQATGNRCRRRVLASSARSCSTNWR